MVITRKVYSVICPNRFYLRSRRKSRELKHRFGRALFNRPFYYFFYCPEIMLLLLLIVSAVLVLQGAKSEVSLTGSGEFLAAAPIREKSAGAVRLNPKHAPVADPSLIRDGHAKFSSSDGIFSKAAVTSDAGPCSKIGSDILSRNGTAIDAAVATAICVGVYCPQSMGTGGGFLMTYYKRSTGTAYSINAREAAPKQATETMYEDDPSTSTVGALAAGIPGELKGLQEAHSLFGKLPWSELVQPTIEELKKGITVFPHMASALQEQKENIRKDPGLSEIFINPETGEVLVEGDTYTNKRLLATLETVAREGACVLYTGQLAKDLVKDIQNMGGIITEEDLANYRAIIEPALSVDLSQGIRAFSVPPPGSGALLQHALLVLDGYRFDSSWLTNQDRLALLYHRIIETFKFTYARRTELGDQRFVDVQDVIDNLTSVEYADWIRGQIEDDRTYDDPRHYGVLGLGTEDHGTSHIAVVAPNGDAVSMTSTVNLYFGARVMSLSTGIILNDEMDDFSSPNITNYFGVPPSPSNYIAPWKRPMSSMSPAIFTNRETGEVVLATGAAGGTKITTETAFTSLMTLSLGVDITVATDFARIHHQLFPNVASYERGLNKYVLGSLAAKHHNCTATNSLAVVNSIKRLPDGTLKAVADGRKGGSNIAGS